MIKQITVYALCTLAAALAASAQTTLYWSNLSIDSNKDIRKADLDGSNQVVIIDALSLLAKSDSLNKDNSIAVDEVNGYIYWTNQQAGVIYQSEFDGSNPVVIKSGLTGDKLSGLAVDPANDKLFWATKDDVFVADLNGNSVQTLLSPTGTTRWLASDRLNKMLYIANEAPGNTSIIKRTNYDGSGVVNIITINSRYLSGLAIDNVNDKLYWIDEDNGLIQRADYDGESIETITHIGSSQSTGLTVDPFNEKLYWTEPLTGLIHRVDLSSNTVDLTIPSTAPRFIAIDVPFANRLTVLPESFTINPLIDNPFRVDLVLDGQNLSTFDTTLHYDPSLLTITGSSFGNYFTGSRTEIGPTIDIINGTWSASIISDNPVTNSDVFVSITFIAANTSSVTQLTADAIFIDTNNQSLPSVILDAEIIIDNGILGGSGGIDGRIFVLDNDKFLGSTATISKTDTGAQLTALIDANGNFVFSGLVDGEYLVTIDAPSHLAWTGLVNIVGGVIMLGDIHLIPGDLDNDSDIDLDDFAILEATFGLSEGDLAYNEAADLIGNDKHVNIKDMVLIGFNFGKTSSN